MRGVMCLVWPVVLLLASANCGAEQLVTVGIFRVLKPDRVRISCESGISVVVGSGASFSIARTAHIESSGSRVAVRRDRSRSRTFPSIVCRGNAGAVVCISAGTSSIELGGKVTFSTDDGKLLIVNEVGIEDYVRGVVANEMNSTWPTEALKAQAVVARTLAVARSRFHAAEGFDLCDTTHCQVYRGATSETESTDAVVEATRGLILTHEHRAIEALYCSTCGGATSRAFGLKTLPDAPYLRMRNDVLRNGCACKASPHYKWTSSITTTKLAKALASDARADPGSRLLTIESPKNFEYLIVDDMLPSGCEVIERPEYGYWGGWDYWWSGEVVHDNRVTFYLSRVYEGRREITYDFRPELVGTFHVMPAVAQGYFEPDIFAHSAERRLIVK